MIFSPILTGIALVLAIGGAAVAWAFVVIYSRPPFEWRTHEAGRHLMRFTFAIAVILSWSALTFVIRLIFGEAEWLLRLVEYMRLVIFGVVIWLVAERLLILVRARRQARSRSADDHEAVGR